MATHLLRDYLTQSTTNATTPDIVMWLMAIFMRRVLGYTVVGQTNFDLDSATYLLASGTTAGNRAGINFGVGATYEVSIPVGVRVVSGGDVGRMLVLRSTANPRFNSGIFLITGINAGSNRYIINWRSGDAPPAEAADSIEWWLYAADGTRPGTRAANGGTGYRSYGSSTCSRVILQSPHALGWQVRICLESSNDYQTNGTTNQVTYAPGFGGNSSGDFPVGGDHLHSTLWWDTADPAIAIMPGQGAINNGGTEFFRLTMIGDTEGTGVYCFIRRVNGPTNWHLQFGMCENEPTPVPTRSAMRLFTLGHNEYTNFSQLSAGLVANSFHYRGIGFGGNGQPASANIASWSHVETNAAFSGAPWYNANAADSPFTGATELLPVDIVTGMAENWSNNGTRRTYQFDPRLVGQAPFVRQGRTNFGNFTLTTDAGKAWQHMQFGIFMMWGGPAVLA
jgi:hypothetical protein